MPPSLTPAEKFIRGIADRFGEYTPDKYKDTVENPPADETQSAQFDESAIDPYELANAKLNTI